ncbi:MAG: universal stress protein [Gemmatimonadaceae bacterium]
MSLVAFPRAARIPAVGTGSPNFDRIVIGVDFASASLAAGRWATTCVAPHAHVVLVHIASPHSADFSAEIDSRSPEAVVRRSAPALVGGLEGFGATLDIGSFSTVVRVGSPSQWLGAIAEPTGATLVVLGRRADSARQRVGEPNVLERVARRTAASVLVVPEGTGGLPDQVLAVLDNSPLSGAVVAAADFVAKLHQIPLIIAHVVPPASGAYRRVLDTARRNGRRRMRSPHEHIPATEMMSPDATEWCGELVRAHSTARVDRVEIRVGDPVREIVSLSAELGSTLVVAGKRGAHGAPIGSIGSITRTLLTSTPLPVLAIDDGKTSSYAETNAR